MSTSEGARTPTLHGGWSEPRHATLEDQKICQLVKLDVEAKVNQKFRTFTAITVSTQVVAGTNYYMKILVDDEKTYLHASILHPLEGHVELRSVLYPRKKDDTLECFKK